MSVGLKDNASGVRADSGALRHTLYDAAGNAVIYDSSAQPSAVAGPAMLGINDRSLLPARMDRLGSLASAMHAPLLTESFEGTAVHASRWVTNATTMAATQSAIAGLTINSGAITTVSTGYLISSVRRHMKTQRSPLQSKWRARSVRYNNSVQEFGFGDVAAFNGAHTTGAYWQVTAGGVVQPVLTYNSIDTTGPDASAYIDPTKYYTYDIILDDDEVTFSVQDTSTGMILFKHKIALPLTQQRLWSSTQLPVFARVYNTAVAPATAPQLILTDCYVLALDAMQNKPWGEMLAGMGRGPVDHPLTGGQLAQWTNSAEPASATLSNTAAGYTTLGGKFQFAAVAGAATDYALFGFQVPTPLNMMITGIEIDTWNTGAAVATTPTLLTWALAAGSTAVSLATSTVSRRGLGAQSLPVGAVPGAKAERISEEFRTPIPCGAGRYVHVILRMPVASATASQVIAGMVNIDGYFE